MDESLRALNRFGLGARVGERERLRDPRAWLRAQLRGGAPAASPPDEASPDEVARVLRALAARPDADPGARREARERLGRIALAESQAALARRAATERPFVERLVAFWSNHLCVSGAAKPPVMLLAGAYEREAIRPHVLGRFEEMVLASARHPAMLAYLDNVFSTGPGSRAGRASARRGARARGLNENHARELLELHTLGVDGGYTQRDVQELARILTGWSVAGRREGRLRYAYRPEMHEPGDKTVLGRRYAEAGEAEGERALRDLCRHPSTAAFVARKLVAHFVADDPPQSAVDRIARVHRETEGDLRAVSLALVDLPEAWSPEARKFRTPQDWVVAMLRALDVRAPGEQAPRVLRQLRHPLWAPPAPRGYGDTAREWADPDSLLNRAELARTVAEHLVPPGADPRPLLDVVDVPPRDPLRALLSDGAVPAPERVALALAGPAFQWR